jgi:hypothetical protein
MPAHSEMFAGNARPAARGPRTRRHEHRRFATKRRASRIEGAGWLRTATFSPRVTVQCTLQTAGSRQTNKAGTHAGLVARRHFLRLRRARVLELKDTPSA